jgi:hypothetical protein
VIAVRDDRDRLATFGNALGPALRRLILGTDNKTWLAHENLADGSSWQKTVAGSPATVHRSTPRIRRLPAWLTAPIWRSETRASVRPYGSATSRKATKSHPVWPGLKSSGEFSSEHLTTT